MLPTGMHRREMGAGLRGLAFVLCALVCGTVKADPACPSGLVSKWTIDSAGAHAGCTAGQTFTSVDAANGACLPAHGAALPPEFSTAYHFSGQVYLPYNGSSGVYQLFSRGHDGGHGNEYLIGIMQVSHSCATPPPPPSCDLEPGSQHGLTYVTNSNPSNKYCVSNCEMQMQTVMQSPDGNLYGLVVNESGGTGAECAGSEVPNVEDPGECVGTPAQCQSSEFPGPVDDTTPEPTGATWTELETGGCVTTESGGIYCLSDYSGPARPDNGLPGITATPDAVVEYQEPAAAPGDTSTTVNYYQSTTVNASTNYGNGGDPSLPGNCGAPGQPACKSTGSCGGVGQPACQMDLDCGGEGEPLCEVKIDETGVPTDASLLQSAIDAAQADADAEEVSARADIDAALADEPLNSWTPFSGRPVIPTGPCQTMSVGFFGGSTGTFPSPELCDAIDDKFKPLVGFFLYLLTGFSITAAVIRARAGQA